MTKERFTPRLPPRTGLGTKADPLRMFLLALRQHWTAWHRKRLAFPAQRSLVSVFDAPYRPVQDF